MYDTDPVKHWECKISDLKIALKTLKLYVTGNNFKASINLNVLICLLPTLYHTIKNATFKNYNGRIRLKCGRRLRKLTLRYVWI